MVLEDYSEMMFLQTVLKKVGFDVEGIQNTRSFNDHLLNMNPDVLLMTSHGKQVHGFELSKGVKRARGIPHVILVHAAGHKVEADAAVQGYVVSPVNANELLGMISDLCKLDKTLYQEKLAKLHLPELEAEKARVLKINEVAEPLLGKGREGAPDPTDAGDAAPSSVVILAKSTMSDEERAQRYSKFSKQATEFTHIKGKGFGLKQVQDHIKALRKEERETDLVDLERERKAFVEHLFRKK